MQIMIVDDSRAMRMLVTRALRQSNIGTHTVIEAEDGFAAYHAIKANKPDLVLSDWNMPKMTGIELLKLLRESKMDVKFGFVTSEGSTAMRKQAQDAGAAFLITKPFTPETFNASLQYALAPTSTKVPVVESPQAVPTSDAVRAALADLFGRKVTVSKGTPVVVAAKSTNVVAVYATDDGKIAGVWHASLAFAASAGAALTLIPGTVAIDCVKKGKLEDQPYENFREVANVLASLFNVAGSKHAKLVGVFREPTEAPPATAMDLMTKPKDRVDLKIDIDGFGGGMASIMRN